LVRAYVYRYENDPLRLTIGTIDSTSRMLCLDLKDFRYLREYCLPDPPLELINLGWAEKYVRGINQVVLDYASGYRPYMTRGVGGFVLLGVLDLSPCS